MNFTGLTLRQMKVAKTEEKVCKSVRLIIGKKMLNTVYEPSKRVMIPIVTRS
jgi:hypothetical protein